MPEFVKSSVWSPAGTRLALGTSVWSRPAKKSRKRRRSSAAGRDRMRGSGGEVSAAIPGMVRTLPPPTAMPLRQRAEQTDEIARWPRDPGPIRLVRDEHLDRGGVRPGAASDDVQTIAGARDSVPPPQDGRPRREH